ncbi:DUF262 domain-containing protein [Streptomyces sp. CRPSP2-6A1]|uniref:DUF262 domain-containing protein n=1 Tax=Streptomyces sp. CRPSP2-6A1 TaxID=2799588 RepID=UPI0018F06753|nr:DUF262 domain-containing protein [Streptomyces sp. CRPSP2-6A1]MBJ7000106.1 DUF262 domain-containing protein [Streptomyces sp. CRPSP2-6A1]
MSFQTPITIASALERIHRRDYVLPAIQREFVWSRDKITRLFDSLMRGYPIGSFLMWQVHEGNAGRFAFYDFMRDYHERDNAHCSPTGPLGSRSVTAILDGQQRLTALNIGLCGSFTGKLPRLWANNPLAYPKKVLHLDLLHRGHDDDLGVEYDFRFLTPEEAAAGTESGEAHWYRVQDMRAARSVGDVIRALQQHGVADNMTAGEVLTRLHEVVHVTPTVNFFLEEAQELDKVLNIFIRVNSGGAVLSYSDLLLSVATAQWGERDARESIHRLVDELNAIGQGFAFSKDLVLKTGLVLLGKGDIRFKVDNFDRETMTRLEKHWTDIEGALRLGVSLLADFGFSGVTLTANSVLIPLTYYLHRRNLGESYRTSDAHRDDRAAIRRWLQRSLMKSGVWGSGLDRLLTGLRATLEKEGGHGWPTEAIEREMARQGKSLRFEPTEIDDLLDLKYGSKRLFPMLAMLYPGVDTRDHFQEDHIFPRSVLRSRVKLRAAGVTEDALPLIEDRADRAANLQLLRGGENNSKQAALPAAWLQKHFRSDAERESWLREYDATGLPEDVTGFLEFYDVRRDRMRERLVALLEVRTRTDPEPAGAAPEAAQTVPDDEPDPGNEGL